MSLQTRLQALATAVGNDYRQLRVMSFGSPTADLTNLATTDKSSLVGAVNEVKNTLIAAAPAGTISGYGGATLPPNWLWCDGAVVSRTTYASLFAAIGTTYGAGDGSTTFGLPNLKGRVPVGRDAAQTEFDVLGETGGAKTHTLAPGEMPTHTHNYTNGSQYKNVTVQSGSGNTSKWGGTDGAAAATTSAGSGTPHNNLPPYQVINYIIKFTNGDSPTDSQLTQRVSVVEAGTNSVAVVRERTKRHAAAMHGGGIRIVGTQHDFAWSKPFYTMGAGRDSFSPNGYFNITMPPDGTVIPVIGHATITSITVGATIAGRICLNTLSAWAALYYILPTGSMAASVPSNFRVVDYSTTVTIPDNWILINVRNFDQATPEFHWGDGLRQAPFYALSLVNGWQIFDASAWAPPAWKRTNDGEIVCRGLIKLGNPGAITTVDASKPGPYRRQIFHTHATLGTARIDVLMDGSLWLDGYFGGANNGFVSLEGVRWFPDGL